MARNIQHMREYQREWARRKRAGITTRIVNKPKKTSEQRKLDYINWRKNDKKKFFCEREKVWGDKCFLCKRITKHLVLHNKAGRKHSRRYDYYKKCLRNPTEWVRLCKSCHTGTHFCMSLLNMNWEEIEERARSIMVNALS